MKREAMAKLIGEWISVGKLRRGKSMREKSTGNFNGEANGGKVNREVNRESMEEQPCGESNHGEPNGEINGKDNGMDYVDEIERWVDSYDPL